jgi:chromosome segregation ATPase
MVLATGLISSKGKTMPASIIIEDEVTQKISRTIQDIQNTLTALEKFRERSADSVLTDGGRIRTSWSDELGQRNAEIEIVKRKIDELNKELREAQEDFPRREALRVEAGKLLEEARLVDVEADKLNSQLEQLKAKAGEIRKKAELNLAQSKMTPGQMEARNANLKQIRRANLEDRYSQAQSHLRGCELDISRAKNYPGTFPAEEMKTLENRRNIYLRKVEGLKQEIANV